MNSIQASRTGQGFPRAFAQLREDAADDQPLQSRDQGPYGARFGIGIPLTLESTTAGGFRN